MFLIELLLTGVGFVSTGIAFWVYMVISLVILYGLYADDVKAATKGWGVLIVLLGFTVFAHGNETLNAWYAANPVMNVLLTLGAYIVGGFLVAVVNWCFMMSRYKDKAREFKADFDSETQLQPTSHQYVEQLNNHIYKAFDDIYSSERKELRLPQVFQESATVNGERIKIVKPKVMPAYIVNWWGMWPFAIFYTAYDPLHSMFKGLYQACAGMFTRLRDNIAGDVTKL